MTRPRRHIPGQVVMLTRRCFERRFFLRPDDYMNAVAGYEFARAAVRNDLDVHAVMVMSNHPHLVVTDTKGKRSDFMRDAMSGIARARNDDLDRSSFFWDDQPFGDTVLLDRDALERKLIYTWLNPVVCGLVERAEDWPGFKILPRHWGKPMKMVRPSRFYGRRSPEVIEFTPHPPPGYGHMSLEEVIEYFEDLLEKAEDEIIKRRRKKGQRFAGVKRVLATHPLSHPRTAAPKGKLSPRFATTDGELMAKAIERDKAFLHAYRTERQRWLNNKRPPTFPCGTVWLRRNAPIKCRDPNPCEAGLAANM
jgi:putative transposase